VAQLALVVDTARTVWEGLVDRRLHRIRRAGSTIAGGLRSAGVDRLFAFDVAAHDRGLGSTIQERARRSGTTLVESSAESGAASDMLF